ncbi:nuclear receptor subfamily 0 group B member 1 [Cynoglossus semilaevis]|uniref:Dax1 n=1 Tax=Cynoglossus semilaevis TaxID=244447 RepID=E5D064_CYNSE|nr:nuclear receptor subfamily 0 group B member 1 [Cynoglossus semilaevis]ACZ51263.1 Dax1 [Cynoglossus semilaevis]
MATLESCRCRNNSILYSILKSDTLVTGDEDHHHHHPQLQQQLTVQHLLQKSSSSPSSTSSSTCLAPASVQELRQQPCSCGSTRRRGILRSPQVTCKAASAVLVKTLRFMKNVPCFRELPEDDQLVLIRSGWAPLLVLGLAQDRVDFETTETVEPSMLQRILTGLPERHSEPVAGHGHGAVGVSVVEIEAIKAFLKKCWSVDISTKEYAYLKGAVLFNPDLEGLRCLHYIQSLRREAHQALKEHIRLIHREDTTRFAKLLIALSMLRSISPLVVAQLFFRPVIGTVNIEEVLMEMFYGK